MTMPLSAVLRIVLRRSLGNRRLLAAMIVGIVLAVGLMATTAIYSQALETLGLKFDLRQTPKAELDIRISTTTHIVAPADYQRDQRIIDGQLDGLGDLIAGRTRTATSATFFLADEGELAPEADSRPRARLQYLTDLEQNIRIDEGVFPAVRSITGPDGGPDIDVALGTETARAFGVAVGDRFDLHPFWRDDKAPITVTVVGLISPINYDDEYWRQRRNHFVVDTKSWDTYPFFVREEPFTNAVGAHLPDMTADLETLAYIDVGSIDPDTANITRIRIDNVQRELSAQLERTRLETELPELLDVFGEKQFFSRLPLLVLTLQIVGIILYYLVMVSTMLVDRQAGEIALLKSRGAATKHIVAVYAVEGLILAAVGMIVGPLLALGAISALGITAPFTDLSGGKFLSVSLSAEAYIWAAVGAALSVLALVLPAYRASRYSIVNYKHSVSRPPQRALFQRYYLDIVVVIVGAILFFQLQESDSVVTENLFGDLKQDPLLLVAPAVFIVAVAVVFLRVFPLILGAVSWFSDKFAGIAVQLGLWHLVRAPLQHARLVLLLILATSIAMFSATFGSTLDQSFDDRASYEAGADLRLSEVRSGSGLSVSQFQNRFLEHPGVELASPVNRSAASLQIGTFQSIRADVLAVDPQSFADVAWFRDDFAKGGLDALLAPLTENAVDAPGIAIPANAQSIGIWAWLPQEATPFPVAVRVRDAEGALHDVPFFGLDFADPVDGGWRFLVAPLTLSRIAGSTAPRLADGPKEIIAVFTQPRGFGQFRGEIVWDDLQYSARGGLPEGVHATGFSDGVVVDEFESLDRWEILSGQVRSRVPDQLSLSRSIVRNGESAVRYAWNRRLGAEVGRGIRLASDDQPLNMIVNHGFLADSGLSVGDEAIVSAGRTFLPVRIAGTFELFPTFDPRLSQALFVVNIHRWALFVGRNPVTGFNPASPNEIWITPAGAEGLELLRADIAAEQFGRVEVFDTEDLRETRNQDPLIAAGWQGLLFISFLAVLILSALGFLVSSFITAQARALEFAILRTMGFSIRQVLAVVSFEQLFIVAVAMAIGTLVGIRLGVLMIEFLGITERGEDVIPPLVLATDWATVGVAYAILTAVFVTTIAVVVLLYRRLAVHQVLRLGEL